VTVIATKAFTFHGLPVAKGDVLIVSPFDAATLVQTGCAVIDPTQYSRRDLRADP